MILCRLFAFFSGLLVVVALQGLTERGNEWLGRWRQQSRYEPSEVARKFDLSREEDLKLQKAGIHRLVQLGEREEKNLREEVRKVEFDENLAVSFKRKLEEEQLKKAMGDIVLTRLERIGVKTIQEFAHLTDAPLDQIAGENPPIDAEDLKVLRDQAKKFGKPQ